MTGISVTELKPMLENGLEPVLIEVAPENGANSEMKV
jgi:hypothetical protein